MDGKISLVISTTEAGIEKSQPKSPTACPIAYALRDKLVKNVKVYSGDRLVVETMKPYPKIHFLIEIPPEIDQYLKTYEEYAHVEPATFTLEVPEALQDYML